MIVVGQRNTTGNSEHRKRARRRYAVGPSPHHLTVIGADVADVVQNAGGWLCDQVLAGWRVTVFMAHPRDAQPLQILGVDALPLTSATLAGQTTGFAASAQMLHSDARVRREVETMIGRSLHDVAVWGGPLPADIDAELGHLRRRPSSAAHAFKAQALLALNGSQPVVDSVEFFRGGPPGKRSDTTVIDITAPTRCSTLMLAPTHSPRT